MQMKLRIGGAASKRIEAWNEFGKETDYPEHYSVFEAELQDVVPICRATIAGTRIVGRLTAG